MRNPGAIILSEGVPLLNSGPKLEPLLISINALSMVGSGGRNMNYRSDRWRLHSLLGLPEAHSPCFPTPTQQQASLCSGSPLEVCHAPAELLPFLSSQSPICVQELRCFVTLWTLGRQASLSMGFSKQESWRGLPCPPLGDLPDPGIKPTSRTSPTLQADSLPLSHQGSPDSGIFPSNKGLSKYLHICFSCLNVLS